MTKIYSILGSLAVASLLFQGCGGDSSEPAGASTEESVAQQALSGLTPQKAGALVLSAQALEKVKEKYDTTNAQEALTKLKLDLANMSDEELEDLLLQDKEDYVIAALEALKEKGKITQEQMDEFIAQNDLNAVFDTIMKNLTQPSSRSSVKKGLGLLSGITDTLTDGAKDVVVGALDTEVGHEVTGAAFSVVLESEGVTVVMLDQARNSETITQIMIDSLGNNWDLTKKMCPMLQENKEFGEKFAALAEERESMARFFFENIDGNMYNCLTDAMLLSNVDEEHVEDVRHSTTQYMAILMDRYADYFVAPNSDASNTSGFGRKDKFVGLLFDTGLPVEYDRATRTFTNHGDGNELANEKFFYALFKTPASTSKFVDAMNKVDPAVRTQLMDNIFLGVNGDTTDTIQGYLNIIAIGSGMYDGIYGKDGAPAYGLTSYAGSMIGFAMLIPSDRYLPYGKAFINAGYEYALFNGFDVWAGVGEKVKELWENYGTNESSTVSAAALHKSAGLGLLGSDWSDDITDLFISAWNYADLGDFTSLLDGNFTAVVDGLSSEYDKALDVIIDGRDDNGTLAYPTEITNPLFTDNDTVYGFHGLIELAIQEDLVNSGVADDLDAAKEMFTLPPFEDITWDYVYNTASEGIKNYWDNEVDAQWLADLSETEFVKEYFYSDAYKLYIPNWLLAFDWLKLPNNVENTHFESTNFDFQSGYVDLYIVSKNDNLTDDVDLQTALGALKENVEFNKVDMGDDSIIAVDENGRNLDGLYVYRLRLVTPEDVAAVIDYLATLGDDALNAVGLDTTHATDVIADDSNTTTAAN